mmetsp:Transcript_255/g.233  ORF Transcript_255/g.233 Transcript_255/m.233 type:complete len:108 (-) Transcript_255:602-925(-)
MLEEIIPSVAAQIINRKEQSQDFSVSRINQNKWASFKTDFGKFVNSINNIYSDLASRGIVKFHENKKNANFTDAFDYINQFTNILLRILFNFNINGQNDDYGSIKVF